MPTAAELFSLAVQHHQAGNLHQAEQLYRQILQADPDHADAHHLLGVLACQVGRHDQAVASIRQALTLAPQTGVYYANLGVAYEGMGLLDEAKESFQRALELRPDDADAHYNLANVLRRQDRLDEATAHYGEALRLKPDYPQARCNLGLTLAAQGELEEAAKHYQEALRLNPNYAEVHNNLGAALTQLERLDEAAACFQAALRIAPQFAQAYHSFGCALQRQGKLDNAVGCFREAIRLQPDYAEAHNNLGYVLERQDKFDEAIRSYRQALQINPAYAEAFNNLGNALDRQDKLDEAIQCYHHALILKPNCAETHNDLATVRMRQGHFEDALAAYDRAVTLKPNFPAARLNRSLLRLLLGDFENGWSDFDYRLTQPGVPRRDFVQPLWDGSDLDGRTILLYAEQGLGDTIQFIRYVSLVEQRGGRVIVECQPALVPLLTTFPRIDCLLAQGSALPRFDVQAPLASLPRIFRTTLATIPASSSYLTANAGLVALWRQKMSGVRRSVSSVGQAALDAGRVFNIGIAWQGNRQYRYDGQRSIPLTHFMRLAGVPGVRLVSLQKGEGTEQLQAEGCQGLVDDHGSRLDAGEGAFMDTAAVVTNLDLVICSDTAVAHLAGALGVPVWLALSSVPDWRWLLERQDSPWYPSMRVFRQTRRGRWDEVFDRMMRELKRATDGTRMKHG
jgi:tetratricopeptide (TPR) repeat protein